MKKNLDFNFSFCHNCSITIEKMSRNYDEQEHEVMDYYAQAHAEHKFDRFMDEINAKVEARYGLSVDDLPDFAFYVYYDEGVEEGTAGWANMVECIFDDFCQEVWQ